MSRKRRRNSTRGTSYAASRGLKQFLALKEWCASQGLQVSDTTSSEDLFRFLVEQGLPDKYKSMDAKKVVQTMGANLLERKKTTDYKVYFISDGEYVKIGYTRNPDKRLSALQTANARVLKLLGVIENATAKTERNLHNRFSQWRVHGEWFRIQGDVLSYLITQFKFKKGGE